ncbi:hypothetical protein [Microbacterium sp. No. 7]|uniref:hypothetical protein n=1 Tax=Microbacterium sp. No. 7 TaxID=1714373 RepID=UPI0006CF4636|nr:hypothetical protein [Microbacterium sp. No. 7]ALJ19087.1 hypothetical protein AOA12_03875 [Microbacterium sp. No. 7]
MEPSRTPSVSRRTVLTGAVAGTLAALVPISTAAAAPNYSVIPLLAGETRRDDTHVTANGTAYEAIDVSIQGDLARLFIPHSVLPRLSTGVPVVWFYHANGSRYTALSSAFQWPAERLVELGAVCICPDYGGASAWTSSIAIRAQKNAIAYVNGLGRVSVSLLRANSGGGSLMTLAYGNRWLPAQRGMYLASATYDMEDLAIRDRARFEPVYAPDLAAAGGDLWALAPQNAARLPQSAWTGARIRVAAATNDLVVPADKHGLALIARANPVAAEVSSRTFVTPAGVGVNGHYVPDWVNGDMITTFQSWL